MMRIDKNKFLMLALSLKLGSAVGGCVIGPPPPATPYNQAPASGEAPATAPADECVEWDPTGECIGWDGQHGQPMVAPADECVSWDPTGECIGWAGYPAPADECVNWDPTGECIGWE